MFERKAEFELKKWHESKNRKPLVIRGARQVGKSTLVREFARRYGIGLFEINMERHYRLNEVFASLDIGKILRELEYTCGKGKLDKGLIFLDEIQAAPNAIKALRYFYEERPDLPIITAGSLLEFTLNEASFSMPVGRISYLYLQPLSFEEFLKASGKKDLAELISGWIQPERLPESAHLRLIDHLRDFFLVGGMPEAVAVFASGGGLEACAESHHSILETYRDDFGKYASKTQISRLRKLLDYVPMAVGEKFRYARAIPDERAKDVRQALDLLATAGIVTLAHHSDSNGLPLGAEEDPSVFKPFFLDVGLMNAVCGIRSISLETMKDRRFVNEGKMAEQFVGQQLLAGGDYHRHPRLHYWLREGRQSNAEIDFLIESAPSIIPVEVKSGASGSLKSLHQFVAAKKSPFAMRLDLNMPSRHQVSVSALTPGGLKKADYPLYSLPLYFASQIERIANNQISQHC
ncbi:MAG: AAA family ATPase [Victivallales bacterium]